MLNPKLFFLLGIFTSGIMFGFHGLNQRSSLNKLKAIESPKELYQQTNTDSSSIFCPCEKLLD